MFISKDVPPNLIKPNSTPDFKTNKTSQTINRDSPELHDSSLPETYRALYIDWTNTGNITCKVRNNIRMPSPPVIKLEKSRGMNTRKDGRVMG